MPDFERGFRPIREKKPSEIFGNKIDLRNRLRLVLQQRHLYPILAIVVRSEQSSARIRNSGRLAENLKAFDTRTLIYAAECRLRFGDAGSPDAVSVRKTETRSVVQLRGGYGD